MSKDKREGDAKEIVREDTEPPGHSDVPWPKPPKPEQGGFRDLFEDLWSNLEDYEDSKKDEAGEAAPHRVALVLMTPVGRLGKGPQRRSSSAGDKLGEMASVSKHLFTTPVFEQAYRLLSLCDYTTVLVHGR